MGATDDRPRYAIRLGDREIDLAPGVTCVVGRDPTCDLRVEKDSRVSRKHATFVVTDGRLDVQDLGSRNGVLLNGLLIDRTATLQSGDRVIIGAQTVVVVDREVERGRIAVPVARVPLRKRSSAPPHEASDPDQPSTEKTAAGRLLIKAAQGLLDEGRMEDAQSAGRSVISAARLLLDLGVPGDERLHAETAQLLLRLAALTDEPAWIDALLDIHRRRGKMLDEEALVTLAAIDPALRARSAENAKTYAQRLRAGPGRAPAASALQRLRELFEIQ